MKILKSDNINAFGGLNFVLEELNDLGLRDILSKGLPELANQSTYDWQDIFYSILSIYFCGGDCIEDVDTVLKRHLNSNPFFKLCSPDTLLRRIKQLSTANDNCRTKRGEITHTYNFNSGMTDLNINLLKRMGSFNKEQLIIDYDNTILFTEKQESKMTYKRAYGFQQGVFILNQNQILQIENREGNSDAKAFQEQTLIRLFDRLNANGITKIDKFRADSASYQYDVIKLLEKQVTHFYIGARNSYVEKYFQHITNWQQTKDSLDEEYWIGEYVCTPFVKYYSKSKTPPTYRLLVKKKQRKDRQVNLLTQDEYQYSAIITNDFDTPLEQAVHFYNKRGAAEREFDVLKNDFGWNNMPCSKINYNNVFLILTAMCRNIYGFIIDLLAKKYQGINPKCRIKKFIFSFIILPAKWIKSARQIKLRVYGYMPLKI